MDDAYYLLSSLKNETPMSYPASQVMEISAVERLRIILSGGQTIYTILRHVSRSGRTRTIDILYVDCNFRPVRITELCLMAYPDIGRRSGLGLKTEMSAADVVLRVSAALNLNLTQEWI